MIEALIETARLCCGYGRVTVVEDLDLRVDAGEVVCLLGSNGAGKTTTLHTIAGVLPALAGDLRVLGSVVSGAKPHMIARRGLSMVPEGRGLFYQLTVADNLRLRRSRRSQAEIGQVLDHFPSLAPILKRRAGLLSGGEQQMLALAGAVAADPQVILIDEMSLGLAPIVVASLLRLVREIADDRGIGVLLVEQHVSAALSVADRGYVLSRGRVVAAGSRSDLERDIKLLERSYLGRDDRPRTTGPNGS